jgi:TatD DNase family protein
MTAKPQMFDTHCHIQSAGNKTGERVTRELWGKTDLTADQLRQRAIDAGVTDLLCVGCDLPDSQLAVEFAQKHDNVWASIGIHPHEAKIYADNPGKLAQFAALATQTKVKAVGECGLDFYYNHSPKADQVKLLRFQIELALKHDLPMVFHVRDAFDDFWPVFDSYKGIRGIIHSFTANQAVLGQILERDLLVGLNGIMTFAKNPEQLAAARAIPLQKLVLETDAPFLTPTPYRGTINEPKHLLETAKFLCEFRGETFTALTEATTSNAQRLLANN